MTLGQDLDKRLGIHCDGSDCYARIVKLIESANDSIVAVSGSLNSHVYSYDVAKTIAAKLDQNPDFEVSLLFSKGVSSDVDILDALMQDNDLFFSALRGVPDDLRMRLKLFHSEKRPNTHFTISDNSVYIEKPHSSSDSFYDLSAKVSEGSYYVSKYSRKFKEMLGVPWVRQINANEVCNGTHCAQVDYFL